MVSFMVVSSIRCRVGADGFLVIDSLDTEIIAAGDGVAHVDVGYFPVLEQLLDMGIDIPTRNILLSDQPAAGSVRIEREGPRPQIRRKTAALGVRLALALMDEYRSGQWELFLLIERIVGKENSPFLSDREISEALSARAVAGGDLRVRRVPIARRPQCPPHHIGDLAPDCHYSIRLHCVVSSWFVLRYEAKDAGATGHAISESCGLIPYTSAG